MTIRIVLARAEPTANPVEDALIEISALILIDVDNPTFYADEAKLLADTLFATLPGGTMDQLLVEILRRKVSLLSIPTNGKPN